jgi:6-bladed beta-propeller
MKTKWLIRTLSPLVIFSACASPGAKQPRETVDAIQLTPTKSISYRRLPVFNDFTFDYPECVRKDRRGNYLVLDTGNHRLGIFNQSMKFIRQIGQIGQGPEDLYTPTDYVIDSREQIYVLDVGNSRVQIFDTAGGHVGMIPVDSKSLTLAVNSRGEILLNQPKKGSLISIYSQNGRLIRQFGGLMTLSHAYPGKSDDESYDIQLSRVHIVTDADDNVYACYTFAPIVQKYDYDGNLIWERRLAGEEVDFLARSFLEGSRTVYTKNVDGVQMSVICADIARDDATGLLYILLGNRAICITNESGDSVEVALDFEPGQILRSITAGAGEIYVNDRASCFRIDLVSPPNS